MRFILYTNDAIIIQFQLLSILCCSLHFLFQMNSWVIICSLSNSGIIERKLITLWGNLLDLFGLNLAKSMSRICDFDEFFSIYTSWNRFVCGVFSFSFCFVYNFSHAMREQNLTKFLLFLTCRCGFMCLCYHMRFFFLRSPNTPSANAIERDANTVFVFFSSFSSLYFALCFRSASYF